MSQGLKGCRTDYPHCTGMTTNIYTHIVRGAYCSVTNGGIWWEVGMHDCGFYSAGPGGLGGLLRRQRTCTCDLIVTHARQTTLHTVVVTFALLTPSVSLHAHFQNKASVSSILNLLLVNNESKWFEEDFKGCRWSRASLVGGICACVGPKDVWGMGKKIE